MTSSRTVLALAAFGLFLNAQTSPVFQVGTRVVLVEVSVTDAKGAPVSNLTKDDFTLLDDGKPRAIDSITTNPDYPLISAQPGQLHLPTPGASGANTTQAAPQVAAQKTSHSSAIIMDEANSWFPDAAQARENVKKVLDKLPPDERIALYVIVRRKGLVLLQDYTTDRAQLKASLAKHFPTLMRDGGDFRADQPIPPFNVLPMTKEEPYIMWRENSDQARFALQALAEQVANISGRKTIFWMTNALPLSILKELGLDIGWQKTIDALNKADVAVDTIDTRGLYAASNQVTGTVGMMRMVSDGTGGNVYFNRNDLDGALAEGIAAARASYTLSFHLNDDERDNKFHTLKVEVKRKGVEAFCRQGYYANGPGASSDLVSGRIDGESLETRAAAIATSTMNANAQLSWFYIGTNRANVLVAAEADLANVALKKDATGLHGKLEVVGIVSRPDGAEAARFADTVNVDFDDEQHAAAFLQTPWHYQHQFAAAAGSYLFRLAIGAGPDAIGKVETPLTIEPWNSTSFAIGDIALSRGTRVANGDSELDAIDPENRAPLVASGKEFVPASSDVFPNAGRLYFYTEIDDPSLKSASPPTITVQIRILDAKTREVKLDTGEAAIANYVRPGNPVVPFATALPLAQLTAGQYTLEVRAEHSSGPDTVIRAKDFEVN
jgi:VWFA-related protein